MNKEAKPRRFDIHIERKLTHPQAIALLEEQPDYMLAASPPECMFALALDGLRRPKVSISTAGSTLGSAQLIPRQKYRCSQS